MVKARKQDVWVSLTAVPRRQMMACAKALGHGIGNNHQGGKAGAEREEKEMTSEK